MLLDKVVAKAPNQKLIEEALQTAITKAPLTFFRDFVMPLLPKESLVKVDAPQKVAVRIYLAEEIAAGATNPALPPPPQQESSQ